MNKNNILWLIVLISIILGSVAFYLRSSNTSKQSHKPIFKATPDKYELSKDPRYLACVDGANQVVQRYKSGSEKMIIVTCKQIERMKIEDLKNSCLMGTIGLLHFIDQKEFHTLKGQKAIDWADKLFCQKYIKK